ncbi:MAG: DHH family phosphoesterase [Bacteroidota bacterium]
MKILENTGNEIINGLTELFSNNTRPVVIVPHSNPDGDAIGSAYGLAVVLKNLGQFVKIITPNDYPGFLAWLNGHVDIINYQKKKKTAEHFINQCSIMICVDFNEARRADEMENTINSFAGTRIMVDHHPYPADFCHFTVSEPSYSSSAELVYDLVVAAGWERGIDLHAAEALYTGIMTDTGSFSHNTSRPNLYKVLTALMTWNIDTESIHSKVYHNFSADRLRLMGYSMMEKMVILPEFRTGYIALTRDELKKYNFVPGDTEGFVNIPLSVSNIIFSALFIEKEGYVKVSLRSKGSFPSNAFCADHFNGGGHLNAAGGEIKMSMNETLEKFTQLLPGYLHQLNNV